MSVYKPFTTSDIITSPFEVNKTFEYQGETSLTGSGINRFLGKNLEPSLWISGSNPTGDTSIQDQFLIYRSVRELYYTNFLEGDDGSSAGTASFNPDSTITGPLYTPNYYNYLPNTLPANRYFPTGSDEIVGIISIPSNLFGEYIKPGSFRLTIGENTTINDYVDDDYVDDYFVYSSPEGPLVLIDDGEGNLLKPNPDTLENEKIGDIIYQHGMIILTSDGIPGMDGYGFVEYGSTEYGLGDAYFINSILTSTEITCSFDSSITLYENQFKCTIRENEYNFSQNPTIISGSSNSGVISDFATGSYFSPYTTTIGLYNNDKELLAVAKLAQPLPLSTTTDTNIIINLDI
tara:strand:+ start:336 stop:1379 length:1044 start_codon:yes stop_codon:yes gene_type:complete